MDEDEQLKCFSARSAGLPVFVVMEQPPGTDDLHPPQDLSASALPAVLDLTRRGRDQCDPGWFHNANSNSTAPYSAQSGGQILPDNALSHTTVTLSYVSRSHVFSTRDSLSGNSSVYGVPTLSKYSLQPPCELGEMGVALNQHYVDSDVDGACDLSAHTELLQSLSQAQLEVERNEKRTSLFNGDGVSSAGSQLGSAERHDVDSSDVLQNGETLWLSESLDVCAASLPRCPVALKVSPTLCEDSLCKQSDFSRDHHDSLPSSSSVLPGFAESFQTSESLLESSKSPLEFSQECLEFLAESSELVPVSSESIAEHLGPSKLLPNNTEGLENSAETFEVSTAPSGECGNFLQVCQEPDTEDIYRDSPEVVFVSSTPQKTVDQQLVDIIGPLDDPESPSATSLDNIDVFMLPEASSSPSVHNSLQETTDDLSSPQKTTQLVSEVDTPDTPVNDANKHPLPRRKSVHEPLIDLTEDGCMTNVLEENLNNTKVLNGNAKVPPRLSERKLPARSSRGMRLESIVMNINSSRYNVSGRIRTDKKSPQNTDGKTQVRKSNRLSRKNTKCNSEEKPKVVPKKQKSASSENCKHATSVLERQSPASSLQASPLRLKRRASKDQSPQSVKPQESQKDKSLDVMIGSTSSMAGSSKSRTKSPKSLTKSPKSPTKSPKLPTKSPSKTKNMVPGKKTKSPKAKMKCTSKKKRKTFNGGNASSMFSPKEPEIRLKYVNFKEEKRDSKMNCFKPFVRVQRKEQSPSMCTLVNYPDEVKTPSKRNQSPRASTEFVSASVPATSCLHLGRTTMQADQQRALVCCLCGQSANAMDLGDLHGPYYSEAYKPPAKSSKEGSEAKEEDSSESDLSDSESCSGSRKWTSIKSNRQLQWGSAEGRSPAAKRARVDTEDWYSPPVVPLGPCEYWLHEDCGVWSAGVFLVRGKIYGLEEAVRAAQSTKCSSCGDRGASLGCLFKGCANKYHYRCALHSDCVLTEENFSIRCRRHKNKSMKVPQSSRQDDR